LEHAAVQLGGVGWFLDAFLELDVLVPERMALEIKTNKVSAALEETILLASMFVERGARDGLKVRECSACYAGACSQASK
jgi:hypothetical protein